MKLKTKKIKHCLLCKNKKIKQIFSLGNLFVSNFVKKEDVKKGIKAPLQVYRALDKLIEIGKIHKIESKNAFVACKNSNCEISNATAFSICEKCEKVTELNNHKLSKYLSNFEDNTGMIYRRYSLEFYGLFRRCNSKKVS